MNKFDVEQLRKTDFCLWDSFVDEHPSGTIFHSTAWLQRLPGELMVMAVFDKDRAIKGGAALVKSRRFGVSGFHLPAYTPYFGPLIMPVKDTEGALAKSEYWKLLQLIVLNLPKVSHYDFLLTPEDLNIFPYIWNGFSSSIRYTFEIKGSFAEYPSRLSREKKVKLRKALQFYEEKKLKVIFSKDINDLLVLLRQTARSKGFDPHEETLKSIFTQEDKGLQWQIFLVTNDSGEKLAGTLILCDKRRGYNLINVIPDFRRELKDTPTILSLYSAIQYSMESGKNFDFEGSVLPGVSQYFYSLGGEPVPYIRLQKSFSSFYYAIRNVRHYFYECKKFALYK